jgi:hypothetical protein
MDIKEASANIKRASAHRILAIAKVNALAEYKQQRNAQQIQ